MGLEVGLVYPDLRVLSVSVLNVENRGAELLFKPGDRHIKCKDGRIIPIDWADSLPKVKIEFAEKPSTGPKAN